MDKNFELYSDAVVKEKEGGIEAVEKPQRCITGASSSRISNLGVDIVRTEDPLVSIKVLFSMIFLLSLPDCPLNLHNAGFAV